MNELQKLQVLLPHWIEHNRGHAEECRKWAAQVDVAEVQEKLEAALADMERVTKHLEKALEAAGGPGNDDHHGHHHHHHNH